mgnify:CR=1 FL=1
MNKKVAFIGHRDFLPIDINERIYTIVKNEILSGNDTFTMGTHGQFDYESLKVCRELRKKYNHINIEIVITSLNKIKPIVIKDIFRTEIYKPYDDVTTKMYEIEETYYKRQITKSNCNMIEDCDILICYVNPNKKRSGAKTTLKYATKLGLKIINLYKEEDN